MESGTAVKSELAAQYKQLCNDELLAMAAQQSTLTVDAQLALQQELGARNLGQADVDAYLAALQPKESEVSDFDEYAERFRHCSPQELQRVAAEPLTLTPEMRQALIAELERRGLPVAPELRGDATLASDQP